MHTYKAGFLSVLATPYSQAPCTNSDNQYVKLENMAIATPVLFRFNYDAMPSLKLLNLFIAVL